MLSGDDIVESGKGKGVGCGGWIAAGGAAKSWIGNPRFENAWRLLQGKLRRLTSGPGKDGMKNGNQTLHLGISNQRTGREVTKPQNLESKSSGDRPS